MERLSLQAFLQEREKAEFTGRFPRSRSRIQQGSQEGSEGRRYRLDWPHQQVPSSGVKVEGLHLGDCTGLPRLLAAVAEVCKRQEKLNNFPGWVMIQGPRVQQGSQEGGRCRLGWPRRQVPRAGAKLWAFKRPTPKRLHWATSSASWSHRSLQQTRKTKQSPSFLSWMGKDTRSPNTKGLSGGWRGKKVLTGLTSQTGS